MTFAKISYQTASQDSNPKWDLFSYRQHEAQASTLKLRKRSAEHRLGAFQGQVQIRCQTSGLALASVF